MKALCFFLMGLCLVACSKSKQQLGGVNVGNGRQTTMATYASSLGFRFQYETGLRLTVTQDEKVVTVDNSSLLEKGIQPSQARFEVIEHRVDQRLLDEQKTLRSNMPALRAEAERRFPGVELSEFSRPGVLGFFGGSFIGGRERQLFLLATMNYDLIVAHIELSPDQPGGRALGSIARTLLGTQREIKLGGLYVSDRPHSRAETFRLELSIQDVGVKSDELLRGCFTFVETKLPPARGGVVLCSMLTRDSDEVYVAEFEAKDVQRGEGEGKYLLVSVKITNPDEIVLLRLVLSLDGDALIPMHNFAKPRAGYLVPSVTIDVR